MWRSCRCCSCCSFYSCPGPVVNCCVIVLCEIRERNGQSIPDTRWLLVGIVFTVGTIAIVQGIAGIRFELSGATGRYCTHSLRIPYLNDTDEIQMTPFVRNVAGDRQKAHSKLQSVPSLLGLTEERYCSNPSCTASEEAKVCLENDGGKVPSDSYGSFRVVDECISLGRSFTAFFFYDISKLLAFRRWRNIDIRWCLISLFRVL